MQEALDAYLLHVEKCCFLGDFEEPPRVTKRVIHHSGGYQKLPVAADSAVIGTKAHHMYVFHIKEWELGGVSENISPHIMELSATVGGSQNLQTLKSCLGEIGSES